VELSRNAECAPICCRLRSGAYGTYLGTWVHPKHRVRRAEAALRRLRGSARTSAQATWARGRGDPARGPAASHPLGAWLRPVPDAAHTEQPPELVSYSFWSVKQPKGISVACTSPQSHVSARSGCLKITQMLCNTYISLSLSLQRMPLSLSLPLSLSATNASLCNECVSGVLP
jgi:hypothetical protein